MVDYSKWKKIEVSDDEDETHPNIDTPSLFKWRHEARVEREADFKKRKQDCLERLKRAEKELNEAKKACEGLSGKELDAAKKAMLKVSKKHKECLEDKTKIEKEERLQPLNVDSLSKDGFQRTYLNKPKPKDNSIDNLPEEEKERLQREFINEHEKEIKQFGMLSKFDDSRRFLQEKPHLVCDWSNNYLIIWCLNLEMEGKSQLSQHVAHQSTCLNYILELGRQLEVDPRNCVSSFFNRIQNADKVYKDMFEDELKALNGRIKKRAQEKLEIAVREAEEEEREQRMGPGGLDPVEVYQTLPEAMQKCFDTRDLEMLKEVISKLDTAEAKYHMERCIASGLWVADASSVKDDDDEAGDCAKGDLKESAPKKGKESKNEATGQASSSKDGAKGETEVAKSSNEGTAAASTN
ncbi:hsp90 co-chaperone Cdc37-like [Varroa destructor]|uniref:Hsp90 co-chaperone Cdc37 n=1 Tax=Varroa destructor TaxID=109461 RepID=A0A7M7JLZ3_VARDE|nr:hsp90 co-chaperone Cdc37-like [Varroa destructor]